MKSKGYVYRSVRFTAGKKDELAFKESNPMCRSLPAWLKRFYCIFRQPPGRFLKAKLEKNEDFMSYFIEL